MNTAIIAPKNGLAHVDTIRPKPTKTEIINAMVERARVKHELDEQSRKIKADALEKKILALARKGMSKGRISHGCIYTWNGDKHVTFSTEVRSPEITALIAEYQKIERGYHFDATATKNAIRQKLNGEPSRVALLNDPEAVKAIDAKLAEWSM